MGTSKFEGNVVCVADHDENYLCEIAGASVRWLSDMIIDAGGQSVTSSVPFAFERGDQHDEGGYFEGVRKEYRESTGNEYPPVMRVKVSVEVEMLSSEQSKRLWEEHIEARQSELENSEEDY